MQRYVGLYIFNVVDHYTYNPYFVYITLHLPLRSVISIYYITVHIPPRTLYLSSHTVPIYIYIYNTVFIR